LQQAHCERVCFIGEVPFKLSGQLRTNDFQQNGKIKNGKNFSANGSKLAEYP